MENNIYLKDWEIEGEVVKLIYDDNTEFFVSKNDFDRAFQCMVSCHKSDIKRDFEIVKTRSIT